MRRLTLIRHAKATAAQGDEARGRVVEVGDRVVEPRPRVVREQRLEAAEGAPRLQGVGRRARLSDGARPFHEDVEAPHLGSRESAIEDDDFIDEARPGQGGAVGSLHAADEDGALAGSHECRFRPVFVADKSS